jgi:hypothetical protein
VHWCFCRPLPCLHQSPSPNPPLIRHSPLEYKPAPVGESPISLVRVICSAYSQISSIHYRSVGAGIRCPRIWKVFSYELDRAVKICGFRASSEIFLVVPISFLSKAIPLVKHWVTVSSGNGREAVNFHRTWVRTSFVEALSSWSLSASHISKGSSISLMSGRSS